MRSPNKTISLPVTAKADVSRQYYVDPANPVCSGYGERASGSANRFGRSPTGVYAKDHLKSVRTGKGSVKADGLQALQSTSSTDTRPARINSRPAGEPSAFT